MTSDILSSEVSVSADRAKTTASHSQQELWMELLGTQVKGQ